MAETPWLMRGEGLLAWCTAPPSAALNLPVGLRPLPGPAAVIAIRYDDSPVGPYCELSVALPARIGLRPGLCVVAMVVTSPEARLACRRLWGLPAEVGPLRWEAHGRDRGMVWEKRGITLHGRPSGPSTGLLVPVRSLQWRDGGPVVAPRRLRARVGLARCRVEVAEEDDPLAWTAGAHRGLVLQGARIVASASRRPAGMVSSVPWRERVVPAPVDPAGGAASMSAPRAYGSVG